MELKKKACKKLSRDGEYQFCGKEKKKKKKLIVKGFSINKDSYSWFVFLILDDDGFCLIKFMIPLFLLYSLCNHFLFFISLHTCLNERRIPKEGTWWYKWVCI